MTTIFKHYKGGTYQLLHEGIMEGEYYEVVIYESLENSGPYPAGTIWVRPKDDFHRLVEVNGEMVPRFQLMNSSGA